MRCSGTGPGVKSACMIRFDRASKRYPNGREALSGASFEIAAGEMVFLTGRSGAGKSTMLKLIALLERPTRGLVMVNGHNTAALSSRKIPAFRRELGVVFQDHRLLHRAQHFRQCGAAAAMRRESPLKEIDKRVRAALDQVGLLDRAQALPLELSVGEQQRVGIARAVVGKPKLHHRRRTHRQSRSGAVTGSDGMFRRFNDVGVTVVVATHDLEIVRSRVCARSWWRTVACTIQPRRRLRAADHGGPAMIGWLTRHLQSALFAAGRLARAPLATAFTVLVIAIALTLPTALGLRSSACARPPAISPTPWM